MAQLFGITGGIGSGKTTIAELLKQQGYPVYNTDREARRIMDENMVVRSRIKQLFGVDIYINDHLNRQEVARQAFINSSQLNKLNQAVHPTVRIELEQWEKQHEGICFVESAILFESKLDSLCQAVICVTAPLLIRIKRTERRDGITKQQVENRINSQMSDLELQNRSQFIVQNDGQKEISTLCFDILDFCRNFVA